MVWQSECVKVKVVYWTGRQHILYSVNDSLFLRKNFLAKMCMIKWNKE